MYENYFHDKFKYFIEKDIDAKNQQNTISGKDDSLVVYIGNKAQQQWNYNNYKKI